MRIFTPLDPRTGITDEVEHTDRDLAGFGCEHMHAALMAAGCLMQYVIDTQQSALPHIRGLSVERREDGIIIDAATRRNLELDRSLSGQPEHTLAGILDHTVTAMGARKLSQWVRYPLLDPERIRLRQEAVEDDELTEPLQLAAVAAGPSAEPLLQRALERRRSRVPPLHQRLHPSTHACTSATSSAAGADSGGS